MTIERRSFPFRIVGWIPVILALTSLQAMLAASIPVFWALVIVSGPLALGIASLLVSRPVLVERSGNNIRIDGWSGTFFPHRKSVIGPVKTVKLQRVRLPRFGIPGAAPDGTDLTINTEGVTLTFRGIEDVTGELHRLFAPQIMDETRQ